MANITAGMVKELRADLLELVAFIQADIDYPDDDIERLTPDEFQSRVANLKEQIASVLENAQKGKMIRDGLRVVIAGKPNVGKSSLLNALLGHERAIVTDIPGTTRDVIEEYINLNGIPLKIVDTAGIRETDNVVEQIGVDKAQQFVKNADLVLYVVDAVQGLTDEDREMLAEIKNQHVIYLMNKSDVGITDAARTDFSNAIGDYTADMIRYVEEQHRIGADISLLIQNIIDEALHNPELLVPYLEACTEEFAADVTVNLSRVDGIWQIHLTDSLCETLLGYAGFDNFSEDIEPFIKAAEQFLNNNLKRWGVDLEKHSGQWFEQIGNTVNNFLH